MTATALVGTFTFAYARPGGALTHPSLIAPVASLSESVWRPPIPSGPIPPPPPHPVSSTGGALLMAEISGVLNYFGSKDLGNKRVALFADKDHANVFSAQGDTRPANAIGPWENWILGGQVATAKDFERFWNWVAVDVSGL